jgi:hypothetical protein
MGHVWNAGEVPKRLWWEKLTERGQLKELNVAGKIILKLILKREDGKLGLDQPDLG